VRAAVGEKAVGEAEGNAVADIVTVTFVKILVVEGFGVGKGDVRAFAAGYGEAGIGGGQGLTVEKQVDVVARLKLDGKLRIDARGGFIRTYLAFWSGRCARQHAGFFDAENIACRSGRNLHGRQLIWHQAPGIVAGGVGGMGSVHARINAIAHGGSGWNPP
jgi:hypothetical protein